MLGALVAYKAGEYVWKAKKLNDPNGPHAEAVNSAKAKLAQCRDGVAQCLDGAGRFADEQTGGKYSDNIRSGVDKAKNLIGNTPSDEAAQDAASDPGSPEHPEHPADPEHPAEPHDAEPAPDTSPVSEPSSQAQA
jgi:hypothetical protein